jgi:hypothetical protein
MLWFYQWFRQTPEVFQDSDEPYNCANLEGMNMLAYSRTISQQACLFSKSAHVALFACALGGLLAMLTALAFLALRPRLSIHRFREHVQVLLNLRARIGMRRLQRAPLDDNAQLDVEHELGLQVAQNEDPPVLANDGEERYTYDVFVSYAEEDGDWVRNVLMPVVEECLGLRLCLHYRDFHPGKQILDNINCCVEGSRRMMFIFSPHFAQSR